MCGLIIIHMEYNLKIKKLKRAQKTTRRLIGSKLKADRAAHLLTLRVAAKKAGMSHTTLRRIELGEAEVTVEQLNSLAAVYGKNNAVAYLSSTLIFQAFVLVTLKSNADRLRQRIANEFSRCPWVKTVWELEGAKLLVEVWADNIDQLNVLIVSMPGISRNKVLHTETFFVFENNMAEASVEETPIGQKIAIAKRKRNALQAKVWAFLLVHVELGAQHAVVRELVVDYHVQAVYSLFGGADILVHFCADNEKDLADFVEDVYSLPGVGSVGFTYGENVFIILKEYPPLKLLEAAQLSLEFADFLHHELEKTPKVLERLGTRHSKEMLGNISMLGKLIGKINQQIKFRSAR